MGRTLNSQLLSATTLFSQSLTCDNAVPLSFNVPKLQGLYGLEPNTTSKYLDKLIVVVVVVVCVSESAKGLSQALADARWNPTCVCLVECRIELDEDSK